MGHHYVPRFYFKKFAFNEENTLVYSMTKDGIIPTKPNAISKISSQKNYNTPEQEKHQSDLEAKFSEIVMEFIKTPDPGSFMHSRDFLIFVCFMMGNNILIREKIMDELSKYVEVVLKGANLNRTLRIDKGFRSKYDLSIAFSNAIYKEVENWYFVRTGDNTTGKFFITSDNPVSFFNPENIAIPIGIDITFNYDDEIKPVTVNGMPNKLQFPITLESVSFEHDIVIVFPLTPSICILGFSDGKRHADYISFMCGPNKNNDPLAFINIITYAMCNKVVYSHSKDFLRGTKTDKETIENYCRNNGIIPSFDLALSKKIPT